MKINDAGLSLIKSFEGCKLVVYLDIAGLTTVGYGHRTDLPVGATISQDEADSLLEGDLAKFEQGVSKALLLSPTADQYAAMVCFAFNVGLSNFNSSTLLRCFNKHNAVQAADEFLRWDKAAGVTSPGLLRRRQAERALFLTGK